MPNSKYDKIRTEIIEVVHKGVEAGLIRLSAGNISARTHDGHIAITPSTLPYDQMVADDITIVNLAGKVVDGNRAPSSEVPMHCCIMRNLPHFNAIFHTHSLYAMSFAALAQEIPVVCLELIVCGGPIPVTPWACPSTEAAGDEVVKLLVQSPRLRAVLLRNHGPVMVGETLDEAYRRAFDLETGATVYHQAKQLGEPTILSSEQIAEVHQRYGM